MGKKKRQNEGPGVAGVISLGCSKNLVDTEFIMGGLAEGGWSFSPLFEEADLLVVNTCGFLRDSVDESTEAIAEALDWKKKRRGGTVVVAGCLVNRCRKELEERYPEVDHFLQPGGIDGLPALLAASPACRSTAKSKRSYLPPADAGRVLTSFAWASLKISDGCDNRCSYCLIPGLRGSHRSRSREAVVAEARALLEAGVRELNIIGQDITRWGRPGGPGGLAGLVADVAALPGDFRVRLLYLHPSRVDKTLAGLVAGSEKIFPYLDIPIQHASDTILARMNRPYGRKDLVAMYRMLRETVPDIALRTTVMVGFPGEGEGEFEDLLSFLRDHPFENLGAFVFSPEEGTPAATLEGQVDPVLARERYERVLELQQDLSAGLWRRRRGRTTEALILAAVEGEEGKWIGRTAWQAPEVDGEIEVTGVVEPGDLVRVRITGSGIYDLAGETAAEV